eukprot:CAMPEP_0172674336 /NCGR_PEP_ID=MMETSP1074-20121228/12681_1 /TAXON_ID=2916 /ORGANISM="Ceratium fusus, Strain PA161109" /LENGTH=59 /DNA_ID=CAMNT_0013491735 /DNA_START=136 /DNA_END=315 /DNA_ORIENTATION=+
MATLSRQHQWRFAFSVFRLRIHIEYLTIGAWHKKRLDSPDIANSSCGVKVIATIPDVWD